MAAELDQHEGPAGSQEAAEPTQRRHRVGDVMHDHRRPDDVGGLERRESVLEVGLDTVDALRQARIDGPPPEAVEELGDESIPVSRAAGNSAASAQVTTPGPQPASTTWDRLRRFDPGLRRVAVRPLRPAG